MDNVKLESEFEKYLNEIIESVNKTLKNDLYRLTDIVPFDILSEFKGEFLEILKATRFMKEQFAQEKNAARKEAFNLALLSLQARASVALDSLLYRISKRLKAKVSETARNVLVGALSASVKYFLKNMI